MNNLAVKINRPAVYDFTWQQAVNKLVLLGEDKGICNMIAASPKAIEEMEANSIETSGESHYETELSKNRHFAIEVLDRVMNCLDLDEETGTRFDRIEHISMLIESLNELKARI